MHYIEHEMPRHFNAIFLIIFLFSLVHLAFKRTLVCSVYYNHKQLPVLRGLKL